MGGMRGELWSHSLMGFRKTSVQVAEYGSDHLFFIFFFPLLILRSLFKPFVKWEKSQEGDWSWGGHWVLGSRGGVWMISSKLIQVQVT